MKYNLWCLKECQFLIGNVKLEEQDGKKSAGNKSKCQFLIGNVKRFAGRWCKMMMFIVCQFLIGNVKHSTHEKNETSENKCVNSS